MNNNDTVILKVEEKAGENRAFTAAKKIIDPVVLGAITTSENTGFTKEFDLKYSIEAIELQANAVINGDMNRALSMLVAQAHTLDSLFNKLSRHAISTSRIDHFEKYFKLALRAQSQSRAAWEAVSNIKNPQIAGYIKQANISQGHQQVNNLTVNPPSKPEENLLVQNELMESTNEKWLDGRTQSAASPINSAMATMEKIHRP